MLAAGGCGEDTPEEPDPIQPGKDSGQEEQAPAEVPVPAFALGSDVSWVSEMERDGKAFYAEDGTKTDLFDLLKSLGQNAVRLRVWVNPTGGWSGKDDVASLALRAAKAGLALMVDFHYSDFFADPSRQTVPSAWEADKDDIGKMTAHVSAHTTEVLQALKDEGVTPAWVQIGNETRNGMVWPTGQLWTDAGRTPEGKANFVKMVNAGYDAAKAVFPEVTAMVHLNNAFEDNDWWFKEMKAAGLKFDAIALSHYPQTESGKDWEQMNEKAAGHVRSLASAYKVPVMVSEVGTKSSNFTLAAAVMQDFMDRIHKVEACAGVFYWEPEVYGGWKPAVYGTLGWRSYDMGAFTPEGRPSAVLTDTFR